MTKIHHTVGLYPNGDMKHNGVPNEHLQTHIEYNKSWRPGRALIVDGVCVYQGNVHDLTLKEALEKIKQMKPITIDTQPYA